MLPDEDFFISAAMMVMRASPVGTILAAAKLSLRDMVVFSLG